MTNELAPTRRSSAPGPASTVSGRARDAPVPPPPRSTAPPRAALPGLWAATAARAKVELLSVARNVQALVFTMLLPVLLLTVLGSIFSGSVPGTTTSFRLVFIAGVIAAGVMSVAFSGLAINLAIERDTGLVGRLAATPMIRAAYFAGKVIKVIVMTVLETVVLIAVAALLFRLPLDLSAERWFTLAWVLLLGSAACALLAIAYSWVVPNGRTAAAVVTPPFLVLQFISGVFFPYNELPDWMRTLAAFFPLKWMAQGMRSVFLPDSFTVVEPAGGWEHGRIALVLALWCGAGLALSLLTFRWRGQPR
jgi:ABC-2 type transport system permease protein